MLRRIDWAWVVSITFLSGVGLFLLACAIVIMAALVGWYDYDYRCKENVVEKREYLFNTLPLAGWEPVDGDPVGACKNAVS